MRVCFFSRLVSLHALGGMQRDLDIRANWLIERGHEVDVITTRHPTLPARVEKDGIHFHFLQETRPLKQDRIWREQSIRAFLNLHKEHPFDLVICVGGGGWQYVRLRTKMKNIPPAVMFMQTPLLPTLRYLLHNPTPINLAKTARYLYYFLFWNRRYGHYLDAVIVLSNAIRLFTLSENTFRSDRIYVVSNGIDTNYFSPGDAPSHLYQKLNITPQDRIALWVGRLSKHKGWVECLEASLEVITQVSNYRLIVIAAEAERDRQEFLQLVCRLGIENYVRLIEDVPNQDLLNYYRLAHILVAPFYGPEAQPWVLIEAMACGLPIVTNDNPPIVDMVRHMEEGVLCSTALKSKSLSRAMIYLLSLGNLEYMGYVHRARERAISQFDESRSRSRTIEILEAVVRRVTLAHP